jgi:trypsin
MKSIIFTYSFIIVVLALTFSMSNCQRTECGKSVYKGFPFSRLLTKIINGNNAIQGSYPWLVSLRRFRNEVIQNHLCTGSIIEDQWILTSANCLINVKLTELRVITGLSSREGPFEQENIYSVEKAWTNFKPNDMHSNDWQLLKLNRKIVMRDGRIGPICLSLTNPQAFTNRALLAAGWASSSPFSLQQIARKVIDDEIVCRQYTIWFREETFCTVSLDSVKGDSTCSGDGGLPLMSWNPQTDSWFLEGIASYIVMEQVNGVQKCKLDGTNYFTIVSKHYNTTMRIITNERATQRITTTTSRTFGTSLTSTRPSAFPTSTTRMSTQPTASSTSTRSSAFPTSTTRTLTSNIFQTTAWTTRNIIQTTRIISMPFYSCIDLIRIINDLFGNVGKLPF